MKFSHKIVTISSFLLLVTASFLSISQLIVVKSEASKLINYSLTEMSQSLSDAVSLEMMNKKSLAKSTTDILKLDSKNNQYVHNVINSEQLKNSFISIGFGYEHDGSIIENNDTWAPDAGFDARTRPWYQMAKEKKTLVVTNPYIDTFTGSMIVSISTPVYKDRNLIGVVFYDLSLDKLSGIVNNINLFDAGSMFIFAEDGTTIANPNSEYNGKKISSYLPKATIGKREQTFKLNDSEFLLQLTHLPTENWYVGALIDQKIAFGVIGKLTINSIILTAISCILSIIILTLLIQVLMRPLKEVITGVASNHSDLTRRLNTNTDAEFSELAQGFNASIESLQQLIQESKVISEHMSKGVDKTVQGTIDSSNAINTQLQELDLLATAMNQMAITASEVANNTQGASEAAQEADDATEQCYGIVSDTTTSIHIVSEHIENAVKSVKQLELAATDIESVLQVINEIANQTNLLALNAAIEAARAGESGRGFAVVADEVRSLAVRTQQSTTEIQTMIEQLQLGTNTVAQAMEQSQSNTKDAVEKAQLADETLQKIHSAIKHISTMNVQIASAAEEQSLVAEEMSTNTLKIKELSISVSDLAQESNATMQEQADSIHQQDSVLGKFTV